MFGDLFQSFFNGMFDVITSMAGSIMVAPITLITALFPDLSTALEQVIEYFTNILMYVPLALDLLMIPRTAIVFLFDYYVIKYSIFLVTRVVKLVVNVYNKFKP